MQEIRLLLLKICHARCQVAKEAYPDYMSWTEGNKYFDAKRCAARYVCLAFKTMLGEMATPLLVFQFIFKI